ncbi:MAG: DUF6152 family protein [Marivibrio sp.]|uniref:DUF6152 family protein n=1 Tax=Marivibrio sp. TaxID=2039719 RepID=UPI0032ED3D51
MTRTHSLKLSRRAALALGAAALLLAVATPGAMAHHGWAWTTGGNIELTGEIVETRLGNPHGILIVDVNSERWTVEVGQPWRNSRAGLEDGDLAPGVEIRAIGEPAADMAEKRLKVERFYLGDKEYDLYPNRD